MIANMKKVALVGERNDLKNVIDTLKADGNFQIVFYKSTGNELNPADAERKTQLSAQLSTVNGLLEYCHADHKTINLTYRDLKNITKKQTQIDKIIAKLEAVRAEVNDCQTQINHHQTTLDALQPFRALPIPAALLKPTRNTFVLTGLIAASNFTRFCNDLDTKNFLYETYPAGHQRLVAVLTGDQADYALAETILDYDFTPFPAQFTFNHTVQDEIDRLTTLNQNLAAQITKLKQANQLTNDQINYLKIYADYLANELDTLEILTATIQTKQCFVIHGWVPAKNVTALTQLIHHTNKNVVIETKDATTTDNPPAVVRNTPLVAPYNSITNMYGAPGRTDLDPNPFVAFFYFFFFGMMFGDVAYGIILSVVTALILIWKRPQGGTKQLMALFCMGGISAAAWGMVFNSFFGLNLPSFIMPRTLLNPLGTDATLFFALSLYLGVIQIMVGNLLNVVNLLRQKMVKDGLFKALPHLVFFIGLTLAFPSLIGQLITLNYPFMVWFQTLMLPGVILIAIGFAGMVLFNGLGRKFGGYLVGAFSGAYKVISYFSDILSYARLFGVGLVGCVIGYVANYLFGMFTGLGVIGYLIGAIVVVIFHVINIGLGLLSTYIHDARLQFVEFFGKFYAGTGTPFTPLGSKLRYTRIQNDTRI